MKYIKYFENYNSTKDIISSLNPELIEAAQDVYNNWKQDEEGYSEMYGSGGICDDIARAMCDVIDKNTFKLPIGSFYLYNEYDYHTSMYVYNTETKECYNVDISPYYYETGAAYTWKQIKDVIFEEGMISIRKVDYDDYINEEGDVREDLMY
jgi:hypothetical protein